MPSAPVYTQFRESNLKFIRVPGKFWEYKTQGFVQPWLYDSDDAEPVVGGISLAAPYTSTITDVYGNQFLKAGTILKPGTVVDALDGVTKRVWSPVATDAEIASVPTVVILEYTTLVRSGDGVDSNPLVNAFKSASVWAKRLPSVLDQTVTGLTATASANLKAQGFVLGEDYSVSV